MRFRKGSKVELFFNDEVPSGSWRSAEVVSSRGLYYTVRCAMGAEDEVVFEKVSAKLIRPCPPHVTIPACLMTGDVVEVLHNHSWKMATVSKVLKGNNFLVRLVGALNEFKICNFDVRLRQSWTNGKWIIVGEGSVNYDDKKCNVLLSSVYNWKSGSIKLVKPNLTSHEVKEDYLGSENNVDFQESNVVRKTMKRGVHSNNLYPQAKAYESRQKFRAIEEDGRCRRGIVENPSTVPVRSYAYPKEIPEEKELYTSINNKMTQFAETDEGIRMNGALGYSQLRRSEFGDADDVTSSVGSCDKFDSPIDWPSRIFSCPVKYAEDRCSDAESVFQSHSEDENSLRSKKEELATEIHRLELHAYRCTLEALHASGPLSWEQETLMTNLRISLHISNDEHLMELRKLISKATSISVS